MNKINTSWLALFSLLTPLTTNAELVITHRWDQCRVWVRDTTKNRPLERNLFLRDICTDPLPAATTPATPIQPNKQPTKPATIAKRQCLKFLHFTFDLRDCTDHDKGEDTDWKEFRPYSSQKLAEIPNITFDKNNPDLRKRVIFGHENANLYHKKIAQAYIDNRINLWQVCGACQAYAAYNLIITHLPDFVQSMPQINEPININTNVILKRPRFVKSEDDAPVKKDNLSEDVHSQFGSIFFKNFSPKELYIIGGGNGSINATNFYQSLANAFHPNSVEQQRYLHTSSDILKIARLVESGIFPIVKVYPDNFFNSFSKYWPTGGLKLDWTDPRASHAIQIIGVIRGYGTEVSGFYINDSGSGYIGVLTANELKNAISNFITDQIPAIWYIKKTNTLGSVDVVDTNLKFGNEDLSIQIQCDGAMHCKLGVNSRIEADSFTYHHSSEIDAFNFWQETIGSFSAPAFKATNGCFFESSTVKLSLMKGSETQDLLLVRPLHRFRYRFNNGICQTERRSNPDNEDYFIAIDKYTWSSQDQVTNELSYKKFSTNSDDRLFYQPITSHHLGTAPKLRLVCREDKEKRDPKDNGKNVSYVDIIR